MRTCRSTPTPRPSSQRTETRQRLWLCQLRNLAMQHASGFVAPSECSMADVPNRFVDRPNFGIATSKKLSSCEATTYGRKIDPEGVARDAAYAGRRLQSEESFLDPNGGDMSPTEPCNPGRRALLKATAGLAVAASGVVSFRSTRSPSRTARPPSIKRAYIAINSHSAKR